MTGRAIDLSMIRFFRRVSVPLARLSLLVVFFWFGFLKIVGVSPASALVEALFQETIPFMPFGTFMVLLGLFEVFIGVLFVVPGAERLAVVLFLGHLVTTSLPLVLVPEMVWSQVLVPTLEGQYIVKNVALLAAAVVVGAEAEP